MCRSTCSRPSTVLIASSALAALVSYAHALAPGEVLSHRKISDTQGNFTSTLDDFDGFGHSMALLGDLDGDGVGDLAVGVPLDDDGGNDGPGDSGGNRGAVWVLFLNDDGTVKSHNKISDTQGNFTGELTNGDRFGWSVARLGDLDGDGVGDLAVGAIRDDDGGGGVGANRGAVWVLFLNDDGTVKSHQKISSTEGGFGVLLDPVDNFGWSTASLGDLDGDGVGDLAVGAWLDDDGGLNRGAVWVLFLNNDGTVKSHQKISSTEGGFLGTLDDNDRFGNALASLGDLDGDGVGDLAVGALRDDDGGADHGALWVLFLNDDGTVKSHQKISNTEGGFFGTLDDFDRFGNSVTFLGDLDVDGVGDLAVGTFLDDDGGTDRGAVWVLFLNDDGTVKLEQKISNTEGGFTGILNDIDLFGAPVAFLGDLDGDGVGDLAVGATGDDDGGTDRGAAWVLFLNGDGTVNSHQKISDTPEGFADTLDDVDFFGTSVAALGDLDGDGVGDLAVGTRLDDEGGTNRGAVWMLFLNADDTVKSYQKISDNQGGFTGVLDDFDEFGASVAALGDLDGDGVGDLAVGARLDDDGGADHGAVWVLFLNADGTVKAHQKISSTQGGFTGTLDESEWFGYSSASLGDLDGDGVGDLVAGAPFDDDGGGVTSNRGALWVLFLNGDGTVKNHQKISDTEGGFTGILDDGDEFGTSFASLGDLDGDGVGDLAVGAMFDDDGGTDHGAVWVLFLNADGTVKAHQKISSTQGGFTGTLDGGDRFGRSLASLGDLDGDGVGDLAVAAVRDDDGGTNRGAVWVLFLNTDGTVKSHQKISNTQGGFAGTLDNQDRFGRSFAFLGDVDGDGVGDLAVGADGDDDGGPARGAVWVLSLDGVPTINFDPPNETPAAGAANRVATGDLDGDGDTDVVIVIPGEPGSNGNIQVFLNQGNDVDGVWLGLDANDPVPVGTDPSGIAVGLLNDDTHLDVVVTNAGDDTITILLNSGAGDGSFLPSSVIAVGDSPSAVITANFNPIDGITDIAVANRNDNNLSILTRKAGGVFVVTDTVPTGGVAPLALDASDIDNDKCPDIVGINSLFAFAKESPGPQPGSVFGIHNQAGVFDAAVNYPIGNGPSDVDTGDLDGDGFADIAAVNFNDDTASLLINLTDGTFGTPVELAVGDEPQAIHIADLDGDGDQDLAVVAIDPVIGPAVQVFLNISVESSELVFGEPIAFGIDADPNFVASADFNNDGLIDLVTVNDDDGPTGGSVTVLLNNPPPEASCLGITSEQVVCHGDGSTFTYTVEGINACTGALDTFTFTASGGAVGEDFCFTLLVATDGFCCTTEQCVTVPDCSPACDLDGDGVVGITDFLALFVAWGPCSDCATPQACPADFDGDCAVGITDLLTLLEHWGAAP